MTECNTYKQYICKEGNTNKINPEKLKTTQYINVENEEISLTLPSTTSNHYLQTDEKAHCKGKWGEIRLSGGRRLC